MRKLVVGIFLCLSLFARSQTIFNSTYYLSESDSTERAELLSTIIEVPGEGFILPIVSINPFIQNSKIGIVKTNLSGQVISTREYGENGFEYRMKEVIQVNDGNYIICGSKANYESQAVQPYFLKIDSSGDTIWTKLFLGNDINSVANSVIETSDSNLVSIGYSQPYDSTTELASKALLLKLNKNGEKIWEKQFGGPEFYSGTAVVETSDNGFLCLINKEPKNSFNSDILVKKVDSDGNLKWTKSYSTSKYDKGNSIIRTSKGDFLIAGDRSMGPGVTENTQGYILKIDSIGNIIWEKTHGGISKDYFFDVIELPDESIVAAGATNNTPFNDQAGFLVKMDNMGDTIFTKIYNKHESTDLFYCIKATQDSGFIMAGTAPTFGLEGTTKTQEAWVVKVNKYGCDNPSCFVGVIDIPPPIANEMDIFPNPLHASDILNLSFSKEVTGLSIKVMNAFGTEIIEKSFPWPAKMFQIDFQNMEPGLFLIHVTDKHQDFPNKKLMVVK